MNEVEPSRWVYDFDAGARIRELEGERDTWKRRFMEEKEAYASVLARMFEFEEENARLDALGVQHAGELAAAHEENARLREDADAYYEDMQTNLATAEAVLEENARLREFIKSELSVRALRDALEK